MTKTNKQRLQRAAADGDLSAALNVEKPSELVIFIADNDCDQFEWAQAMHGAPVEILDLVGDHHARVRSKFWAEDLTVHISYLKGFKEWMSRRVKRLGEPSTIEDFKQYIPRATHLFKADEVHASHPVVVLAVDRGKVLVTTLGPRGTDYWAEPSTLTPIKSEPPTVEELNPFKLSPRMLQTLEPVPDPDVKQDGQDLVRFIVSGGTATTPLWIGALCDCFGIAYGSFDRTRALEVICRLDQFARFVIRIGPANLAQISPKIIQRKDTQNIIDVTGR